MNDGKISLPPSVIPRALTGDLSSAVKILSMPPNMPTGQNVQGEVVSHDKNVIVLKTDHGLVAMESKQSHLAAVQTGDVIQLRLHQSAQLKAQNIQNAMAVEILSINGKTLAQEMKSPQSGVVQGAGQSIGQNAAAETNKAPPHQVTTDRVALSPQNIFEIYSALRAQLLGLPQNLDQDALVMVMKTLLRLPLQDPLPPSLQEGFDKFTQLTSLLQQANLLPEQQLRSPHQTGTIPEGLLTALQNLLQVKGDDARHPLLQQMPQQFIQLQTILPGQHLSPNILVDIRNQLLTILAQINAQPLALQMQTAQTQQGDATSSQSASATTQFYTMPAIGIVMGMAPNLSTQPSMAGSAAALLQGSNLVLMMTPDGQNLMGVLSAAQTAQMVGQAGQNISQDGQALLPGTVFVVAFQPQTDKALSIPFLPLQILGGEAMALQSLHLSLGDAWPALDDLWQAALAQQGSMPEIMAALRQTIPSPQAQQFPPALLFFLSVVKNGFFENWGSPDQFKALDKAEIVRQLMGDMRMMQTRLADDGNPESWKPLPVPLQMGDQLLRLQFFYRHPDHEFADLHDGQNDGEKNKKTRFILNVPHTSLGDVQIDGLVQFNDLEMILRTERALPSQAEHDIRSRYQTVLETTGMQGNILFQSGREHYIRV